MDFYLLIIIIVLIGLLYVTISRRLDRMDANIQRSKDILEKYVAKFDDKS